MEAAAPWESVPTESFFICMTEFKKLFTALLPSAGYFKFCCKLTGFNNVISLIIANCIPEVTVSHGTIDKCSIDSLIYQLLVSLVVFELVDKLNDHESISYY